jgi:predicted nucleotidyltransferase
MDVDDLPDEVNDVLRENGVVFAYLHGSHVRGEEREDSDLDIAVYSEVGVSLRDRATLSHRISKIVGVETDVACLESAPMGFRHQVLKYGELIYSRDDDSRKRFEEEVYRKYLDIKPLMKRFNRTRRSA